MIEAPTKDRPIGYEALFQCIKTVPTQYLDEIFNYVNFILYRNSHPEPQNKATQSSGLEEFYGCMDFDGDPLEIQKRMRNEWN